MQVIEIFNSCNKLLRAKTCLDKMVTLFSLLEFDVSRPKRDDLFQAELGWEIVKECGYKVDFGNSRTLLVTAHCSIIFLA